jgi:sigma-B regulation protein RsbU (phosphoserine phosphatase)
MSDHAPAVECACPDSAHTLQCMEVWGGASHADHATSVPGLDIFVQSTPFNDGEENTIGGGDVYYISRCGSGRVTRIALADVSGHGSHVNGLAEQLRKAMRKSVNTANQSNLARKLNTAFEGFSDGERFATAFLATYYAPTDHLVFVNAGHPPPLLRKWATGEWMMLDHQTPGVITDPTPSIGIRNLPLGVIDSTEYQQLAIKLEPGDYVLMYTDAYSESMDHSGNMLGSGGLANLLGELDTESGGRVHPSMLIDNIKSRLQSYRNAPAQDDETALLIHHNGTNPEKLSIKEKLSIIGQVMGIGTLDTTPAMA